MNPEAFWQRQAGVVAARVNFAWWLKHFTPWLLGVCALAMAALLIVRRSGGEEQFVWLALAMLLVAGAAAAIWSSKRKWHSRRDALARLDWVLQLNNRLISAQAGIGEWPQPRDGMPDPKLGWNWNESLLPSAGAILLLAAAAWIPIPQTLTGKDSRGIEKPLAMKQVEEWVEDLKQAEQLEQEKVEALARSLQELSKQNPEQWYSQASLEAAENLRDQAQQSIRTLQRDTEVAQQALETLANMDPQNIDPQMAKELAQQLGEAAQGMQAGKLGLNQKLMQQLQNIDPNQLKNMAMNKEQLQQLQKNLQQGLSACKQCLGVEQEGMETAGEKEGPGNGGVSRGRGDAPLTLKGPESQLGTDKTEGLQSQDLSRALPGDTLAVSSGKHEADSGDYKPASGGDVANPAEGGEAVWRDNLVPAEREVLRRYFK